MSNSTRILFALLAASAMGAASADPVTVLGRWRAVSASFGPTTPYDIEVRRAGAGFEIVADGEVFAGYGGDERRIAITQVFDLARLQRDFSAAPAAVLHRALGQVYRRRTLEPDGPDRLVESFNVTNLTWTGDRLDRIEPEWRIDRVFYVRIGPAPGGALRLGPVGAGVFTCYRIDANASGCLDVRNGSTRRIRVYLDGAPGVLCTADPGVYCSVPVKVGIYAVRLVADDEQGVGPTLETRIDLTPGGVRLEVQGDLR